LKILEGHNTPVRRLLYTPAGDFLVSADELTIHRWAIDLLSSLLATPAAQLQPNQLRTLLTDPDLDPAPRAWISFSLELAQRQRRFDIELDDVEILSIGEYDIELD
jgi:hypothetical protein